MTKLLRVRALTWGEPAVIREVGADGRMVVYRERFDDKSFAEIPDRVPLLRHHYRSEPIGWATLAVGPDGLLGTAETVDTVRARDTLVEVDAGLSACCSISFEVDEGRDVWSAPTRGQARALPSVLRRGATLYELSIVHRGAYPSARVELFDPADELHKLSERELAPLREQRERELAARRARNAELMDWVAPPPPIPPAQPAPEPVDLAGIIPDRVLVRRGMGMQW